MLLHCTCTHDIDTSQQGPHPQATALLGNMIFISSVTSQGLPLCSHGTLDSSSSARACHGTNGNAKVKGAGSLDVWTLPLLGSVRALHSMDDAVTVTQSKSRAGTSLAAWQQAHEMACRAVVNLCLSWLLGNERTIRPGESTPRRFLAGPQGQGTA